MLKITAATMVVVMMTSVASAKSSKKGEERPVPPLYPKAAPYSENNTEALFRAIVLSDKKAVLWFIHHGASLDTKDARGQQPLHKACDRRLIVWTQNAHNKNHENEETENYEDVIRILLKHGAFVNAQDGDGNTPLHRAVHSNQLGAVKILLECGASVTIKDACDKTPLDYAKEANNEEMVRILLTHSTKLAH